MNPFKDLGAAVAALASIDVQLKRFREDIEKLNGKFDTLSETVQDLRIRVARLEAVRDADRSQMATELERFKLQVERFELRLRQLPSGTDTN